MSIQQLNDLINQVINPLGGEPKVKGANLNMLLKTLAAAIDAASTAADASQLARLDQANRFAQPQTVTYSDGETGQLIGQGALVYNGFEIDSLGSDLTWRAGVNGSGNFEFATTSGLNAPAHPTVMFDTTDLDNPASAVNVQALKDYVAKATAYAGYTPLDLKTAVVNTPAAAWAAGELLDSYYQALPPGTRPGMKFIGSSSAGTAYVYECLNASRGYEGAAMTPVYTWVRWAR